MRRTVLIDTNILLDAMMSERPEWKYAAMLLDEILYGKLEGHVAATSLKDAYFIMGRYTGEEAAREFVKAAPDAFTIVEVDEVLCRVATSSDEPDFEDGVIRACAERACVDFIISRDEKAFARSSVKRLSARDYVDLFCEVGGVKL